MGVGEYVMLWWICVQNMLYCDGFVCVNAKACLVVVQAFPVLGGVTDSVLGLTLV